MSEETPPAKKAARKTVRKKSASKRAPRKSATSENSTSDEQLPLGEAAPATDSPPQEAPVKKVREPKSGVRDARRETSDEPLTNEVSEKLVSSENSSKDEQKPRQNDQRRDQSRSDQGNSDQGEGRNRGRNRGRGRGQERDRERPEKREPKARVSVDGKEMAKKAWKIFESEVTEEGLALLDDNGLRDYARSSFNAARIFLEEEGRVTGRQEKAKKPKQNNDRDDD